MVTHSTRVRRFQSADADQGVESGESFFPEFAQVGDRAGRAVRLARLAHITSVQDQPVVRIQLEFIRHQSQQAFFNLKHGLSRCDAGAITDPEDMGVNCNGWLPEGRIQDDVGSFPSYPGKLFQLIPVAGNLTAVVLNQQTWNGVLSAMIQVRENHGWKA